MKTIPNIIKVVENPLPAAVSSIFPITAKIIGIVPIIIATHPYSLDITSHHIEELNTETYDK